MKLNKYIPAIFCAISVLASCEQVPSGTGNATVGFKDTELEVRENAGTVKIPFVFEGESPSIITFDVDIVTDGDYGLEDAMHITQYKGLKYKGDPSVPVYLECQIINDDYVNDPKVLTLNITNVTGATVSNGEMTVTILDNDNNPYDKLCGNWTFEGISAATGKKFRFPVVISGGFTAEEEADNYEKVLVCWGFNGFMDNLVGTGLKPEHSPVWYLDYDADEKCLLLQTGTLMAGNFIDKNTMNYVEMKVSTAVPDGRDWFVYNPDIRLKATWSEDMKTIRFNEPSQKGYGIASLVYTDATTMVGPWGIYTNITMTQK